MSSKEEKSSDLSSGDAGKKFRLVVRSAEEAVRVIREKLGEDAKVLSVRQVGGSGLKRFVSSPKLEVIAHVPEAEVAEIDEKNVLEDVDESKERQILPSTEVSSVLTDQAKPQVKTEVGDASIIDEKHGSLYLLERTGFDRGLINFLQTWSNWKEISELPIAEALKEITVGLSDRFRKIDIKPTSQQIAFIRFVNFWLMKYSLIKIPRMC